MAHFNILKLIVRDCDGRSFCINISRAHLRTILSTKFLLHPMSSRLQNMQRRWSMFRSIQCSYKSHYFRDSKFLRNNYCDPRHHDLQIEEIKGKFQKINVSKNFYHVSSMHFIIIYSLLYTYRAATICITYYFKLNFLHSKNITFAYLNLVQFGKSH